ncbi:P-loop containing nucleoside triphosphate hydrolase protein [Agrocybe pediades]|nr:P-loop containing nucleoside triphosphate hydrolase protein [Agrocybe pediades]
MHPSRATTRKMAPSASKQKCLAEEAAGGTGTTGSDSPSNSTPAGFQGGQHEDLNSMARLMKITDRRLGVASGVLSDPKGRAIKIDQYTLSFRGRLLIEGAEIALNYSQRYGLLGENGSGKSTFLQSIAEHDIEIPEHIDIYLVRGEAEPSEVNAIDFIVASAKAKVACLEAYIEELSMAYEELEEMDPSTFEAKAGSILHGLRFTQAMKKNPTKDMSSGWRMCVALARALFIKPHLLLDKPTNHSDLDAMVRLEAYLSTYNHTLVITSHSQDFTDTVCTNITDLTHKKKLIYYGGNYPTYIKSKQKIIDIDKMEAAGRHAIKVYFPPSRSLNSFNFEDACKLPPPMIAFDNVAFFYSGKKEDYLYKKLSFSLCMDSRVAVILGANGTGKSTLLHLITGALQPCEGTISTRAALKFAKDPSTRRTSSHTTIQLGRFGLSGAHQTAPIKQLSDGLRNRYSGRLLMLELGLFVVEFGLFSQVAEELWEVVNKTIINLTKKVIDIVDYKKNLIR